MRVWTTFAAGCKPRSAYRTPDQVRTAMRERWILLADNDPDYLDTCAQFLQMAGYRVHKVGTRDAARDYLETHWVHLAILDVRLVSDDDDLDRSGLDLAIQAAPRVPKVILTRFPSYEMARP